MILLHLRSKGHIATHSTTQEPAGEVTEQIPPVGPASLDCLNKPPVNNSQHVPVFSFRELSDPKINELRKIGIIPFSTMYFQTLRHLCEPSRP